MLSISAYSWTISSETAPCIINSYGTENRRRSFMPPPSARSSTNSLRMSIVRAIGKFRLIRGYGLCPFDIEHKG